MSTYIHCGSKKFNPDRFPKIHNYTDKPRGGLWASRIGCEYSWSDWCKEEHFRLKELNTFFRFQLASNAKVLHIYGYEEIKLLAANGYILSTWCGLAILDYEKMMKEGCDAVELHYSGLDSDLHQMFRNWDCDSIVILNPNAVMPCPK